MQFSWDVEKDRASIWAEKPKRKGQAQGRAWRWPKGVFGGSGSLPVELAEIQSILEVKGARATSEVHA